MRIAMLPRPFGWCALLGLLACASCWRRSSPPPAPFTVARVSPVLTASSQLLLNDAITVYFSEPVDPMSVTRDSFAVLDAAGHAVRGRLHVDGTWVTFEPEPPLAADLRDGSLVPGGEYRLAIAGYPRPDGVRSRRGDLLQQGWQQPFRTAAFAASAAGPAPLRPVQADVRPFVLRPSEPGAAPLPVDDARLQLHFTLPVLPTTVTAAAFDVRLFARSAPVGAIERVIPRAVRLLPRQPGDEFAGSTVELEFGAQVRTVDGERTMTLQPEDLLVVSLVPGEASLRDYAGRTPPQQVQWCNLVPGFAVKTAEWPAATGPLHWFDADLAAPGFEVTEGGAIRPLVRVEAGDGSLGLLRPTTDVTIAVGEPFDRGDGVRVASADGVFAFAAIDIPAGVTVRVDARARGIQLQVLGRVQIAGRLEILGTAAAADLHPGQLVDPSAIAAVAAVAIVAGSGIDVTGRIDGGGDRGGSVLALITSGGLDVQGSLPADSLLATERSGAGAPGTAVRCRLVRVQMTPGLPPGAEVMASGMTPFVQLPADRAVGALRIRPADTAMRLAWQVAPADPVARSRPDLAPGRAAPPREIRDGERLEAEPGAFLRLRLQARVVGGAPLPRLLGIDVLDR